MIILGKSKRLCFKPPLVKKTSNSQKNVSFCSVKAHLATYKLKQNITKAINNLKIEILSRIRAANCLIVIIDCHELKRCYSCNHNLPNYKNSGFWENTNSEEGGLLRWNMPIPQLKRKNGEET